MMPDPRRRWFAEPLRFAANVAAFLAVDAFALGWWSGSSPVMAAAGGYLVGIVADQLIEHFTQ